MKKILFFILIIFLSIKIDAQTIKVLNKSNLQAIPYVVIYNQTRTQISLTNINGKADLAGFTKNDTLFFQHTSFKNLSLPYSKVIKLSKGVLLSESVISVDEIFISANKWEQNREEIPNKITSIKQDQIQFNNPQSAADILEQSNQVFVQKSQMAGGSPMIRGFATNSVLLVVDGVRLNNAIYRTGNLQNVISLDANCIDNSEIIFGPGSVIYGSDALGGVMDFHTRKATLSTSSKMMIKANALTRYSSANNENTGHIDFTVANDKLSLVTSFTESNYDDLRMGSNGNNNSQYLRDSLVQRINGSDNVLKNSDSNIQKPTAYNQINFMQKLRFKPNKNLDFTYSYHYSKTSDQPRYDKLRELKSETFKYAEWYYGPQQWQMHSLTTKYSKSNLFFDEVKFIAAYQNYKESRHSRKFGKTDILEQFEDVDIYSFNLDFYKDIDENNHLFYGLEGIYNGLNSTAQERNVDDNTLTSGFIVPRYPDGDNHYYSSAAYLGYKRNINTETTLNSGIRYSFVGLQSTFENAYYNQFLGIDKINNNNNALNGSLGLVYRPSDYWKFNINASTGFHAPNWDGLGKVFTPKKGVVIVPNTNLKPEYAYNLDFGIMKKIDERINIQTSFFYTYLDDPIVQHDFSINGIDSLFYDDEWSKTQAFVNYQHATIYGASLELNGDITENFGLKSNISYSHGEDNEGNALRHVAPLFGSTHIIFTTKKLKIDAFANYNGEIKSENLAPSEQGKDNIYAIDSEGNLYSPAWFTINLKASYQIIDKLQINAGIENITDQRYRPYSSGICAPGRNFIIALRFKM